ncbi:MAG: RluA family pseudouridine synthase, partial [Magnetovibrio sp.]|nr:RluA family pseudouridine synthase [Magnetovibrio sp.]
ILRIPTLDKEKTRGKPKPGSERVSAEDAAMIQGCVMHMDDYIIVLNKPAGLAVQGGSNTTRHVDGMLDALKFDTGERPRLVHRIDKDTSGILVLARSQKVARQLTESFRGKAVRKAYWGIVVGIPEREEGRIELPLSKRGTPGHERMVVDEFEGKYARTEFKVIETLGKKPPGWKWNPSRGEPTSCAFIC